MTLLSSSRPRSAPFISGGHFKTLKRFGMKLNHEKCAFGVSIDKFFGFMINERGIEACLEKVKAVLDMLSPKL